MVKPASKLSYGLVTESLEHSQETTENISYNACARTNVLVMTRSKPFCEMIEVKQ